MKLKVWIAAIGMACLFAGGLAAQSHLAVELGHPVYGIIETAELRGVVSRLSSVKPYTRAQVADMLALMLSRESFFSAYEMTTVRALSQEFSDGVKSDIASALWKAANEKAALGFKVDATGRFNVAPGNQTDLWHLNSLIQPYVKLYPESWLSMWGTIGITYDKIDRELYLPYTFTKEWDTYHNKVSTTPTTDGEEDYPTWSFDLRNDISGATDSGSFRYRLSRFRRDWGMGSGSLALSSTARPFMGLEFQFRPSDLFALSHLVGSLGNWEKGGVDRDPNLTGTAVTPQKMFAIQRLELFPFPWLTLSANGTMIGAKRMELGYLSPMMFAVEYQVTMSDIDNMALQADAQVLIKKLGKFYASFFIDEMELSGPEEWFTRPRNMFAYQGGAKFNLPVLPFGMLTAQYTKIEPFVYAHYPTWTNDSRLKVDTTYTHDGENLGYHLPPNSDELLVRLEARPAPGLRLSLQYNRIRHGDNDPATGKTFLTDYKIYGDVDKYQNYSNLKDYPDKVFLKDGVYDYNHLGSVDLFWRPAGFDLGGGRLLPFEVGLGYGISYTYWEDGAATGASLPDPEWRQFVKVNLKLFL